MTQIHYVPSHDCAWFDRIGNYIEADAVPCMQASLIFDLGDMAKNALMGVIGFKEHEASIAV